MNIDDILANQIDPVGESCLVCRKSLAGAIPQARLKYGERMVAVCCPLCLETFNQNPDDWTRRGATRREIGAIFDLLCPKPAALK